MPRFSPTLLDHAQHPRGAGVIEFPHAEGHADRGGQAPRVTFYLRFERGHIEQAKFTAFGCGCTIAACSILTEMVCGLTLEECQQVHSQAVVEALGGLPSDKGFCADIAVRAFQAAVAALAKM